MKRKKIELQQSQKISQMVQNEGPQGSDIIRLNIAGTEMFARRDTLTVMEDSHLAILFSGQWDSQLVRDERQSVYMDLKPEVFKEILNYLYLIKIDNDNMADSPVPAPLIDNENREAFDMYMKLFRLRRDDTRDEFITQDNFLKLFLITQKKHHMES